MSFVTTQPEMLTAVAGNVPSIGSAMTAGNVAAAAPTTGMIPPAADELALTATQFAAHAGLYHAVSAQAAAIHEHVVATIRAGAGSYAATEAANAIATS